MFQMVDIDREPVRVGGTLIEPLPMESQPAPVDLVVAVLKEDGHYTSVWDYDAELYDLASVQRMQRHFLRLLTAAAAAPDTALGDIDFLDDHERRTIASWSTAAPADVPGRPGLLELVRARAGRAPGSPALICADRRLSYGDMDYRSDQLADRLAANGVVAGARVGVLLDRGVDMVLALLAVLKLGAVHLPLDPGYPAERLRYMVADADPVVLLSRSDLLDRLPTEDTRVINVDGAETAQDTPPADRSEPGTGQDDLAYLIYTSGSTGRPKAVAVPHRGLPNLIAAQRATFALTPADRVLQFASPNFDAYVFELLLAFGAGAELHILPAGRPDDLTAFLADHAITAAVLPPSTLAAISHTAVPALHTLTVAGEACPPELARRWSVGRGFHNLYGPTEATIWATHHQVDDPTRLGESVPIGRPIPGAVVRVLDDRLNPVPVGVPGGLYLGGDAVVTGYLGRPALTAARFVPDPFADRPGARLHVTGDIAVWTAEGELRFLGRDDHQVKIRGFRVDLGEIEGVLGAVPNVREVVVAVRENPSGPQLVAYLVVDPAGHRPAEDELSACAARSLPEHMIPARYVWLDRLPVGPNGKVSRAALPAPVPAPAHPAHESPVGPVEELVAELWSELLGDVPVGRRDDFFELGGHSLLATMVVTRLRQQLDLRLPVRVLFDQPVLADFVDALLLFVQESTGDPQPLIAR